MKLQYWFLFVLSLVSISSLAQTPKASVCNQPMAEAVTHVKLKGGSPLYTVATPDGCWLFAAVRQPDASSASPGPGIAVLRRGGGRVEQTGFFPLRATGENAMVTHDGKVLVIAADRELVFLDVAKLTAGSPTPILGRLADKHFLTGVGIALSADDHWAFVVQYGTQWVSVVDIRNAATSGAKVVGGIATGVNPHSPALSPDGRFLYVPTDESLDSSWPLVCKNPGVDGSPATPEGLIQVIRVDRAVTNAPEPVVAMVKAGCSTRRVAVSPDGRTIFATAAFDKSVLVFDAQPMETGQSPVLRHKIPVGTLPIGITIADGGKKVIAANATVQGPLEERRERKEILSVIDVTKVSSGTGAVLGTLPAGADPRNITTTYDGRTLLISNTLGTLEIIDLDRLPLQAAQPIK